MKRATTEVEASWPPTPTTHAVRLRRPNGFHFQAGQHAVVEVDTDEGRHNRFLSIASAPADDHLEFAVRLSDSAFKRRFAQLAPGDTLSIAGPLGAFTLDPRRPALLLSGGIGITPLLSMLREAYRTRSTTPITLLYANRDATEIPFRDELDDLAHRADHIRVTYFVERAPADAPHLNIGRIGPEAIRAAADATAPPIYYVCGPPGMVQAMRDHLRTLNVPPSDVRREDFTGY